MSLRRIMMKYNITHRRLGKYTSHAVSLVAGVLLGCILHMIYQWAWMGPWVISTYNTRLFIADNSFSFDAQFGTRLGGKMSMTFDLSSSSLDCSSGGYSGDRLCRQWEGIAQLDLHSYQSGDQHHASCVDVEWKASTVDQDLVDCIFLQNVHMYGGAEVEEQRWPIQNSALPMQEYIPGARGTGMGHWSILERYWLFSNGIAVVVGDSVPLHVSQNSQKLCLKASYKGAYYHNIAKTPPILKYTLCSTGNVKDTHLYMAQRYLPRPKSVPDLNLVRYPMWSTWVRYKKNINQTIIIDFVNQIKTHGYKSGYIGIDDMYTPTYGDLVFDTKKFPDAPGLLKSIHNMGFNVTSWVNPLAAIDSAAFSKGVKLRHWVKEHLGKVTGTAYAPQGGVVATLDFTKPAAVDWYWERLAALKQTGVDSFKFDLGECSFLPLGYNTHSKLSDPSHYITSYVEAATREPGLCLETRVGYKTQDLPIYVRIQDRYSTWGYELGLRSVIPTVLQVGLIGYPFIIPDMLAGNAYLKHYGWPDKELFIRWLQLNIFLPVVQYSIPPWYFDEETVQIAREMEALRDEHVVPRVIRLAQETVHTGHPIIRPLWWAEPQDEATYIIDSQFLLGDDVLVAPILLEGARSRSVYVPSGRWRNMLSGQVVLGRQVITDITVNLNQVLWFMKIL